MDFKCLHSLHSPTINAERCQSCIRVPVSSPSFLLCLVSGYSHSTRVTVSESCLYAVSSSPEMRSMAVVKLMFVYLFIYQKAHQLPQQWSLVAVLQSFMSSVAVCLGTGTMMADFRQGGTLACARKMLKVSVKNPASWSEHAWSTVHTIWSGRLPWVNIPQGASRVIPMQLKMERVVVQRKQVQCGGSLVYLKTDKEPVQFLSLCANGGCSVLFSTISLLRDLQGSLFRSQKQLK